MNINAKSLASEVIENNPSMLLMLEHFNIPLGLRDITIEELCYAFKINLPLFLMISNLFIGIKPDQKEMESINDITSIIRYLENSHKHYTTEKFPLLTSYLGQICDINNHPEIELLKQFFDDYLDEVADHLSYESNVVFPYALMLTGNAHSLNKETDVTYSMAEYKSHHDDIEIKLNDLKSLLIRHLPSHNDSIVRRKLLMTLNELEFDLHIHSLIEEILLIPIVERFELNYYNKHG